MLALLSFGFWGMGNAIIAPDTPESWRVDGRMHGTEYWWSLGLFHSFVALCVGFSISLTVAAMLFWVVTVIQRWITVWVKD